MEVIAIVSISILGVCFVCGLWNIWEEICCPNGCNLPACCHSLFVWSFRPKKNIEISDETPLSRENENKEYKIDNIF